MFSPRSIFRIFRLPYFASGIHSSVYITIVEVIFFVLIMLKLGNLAFADFLSVEHDSVRDGSGNAPFLYDVVTEDTVVTLLTDSI